MACVTVQLFLISTARLTDGFPDNKQLFICLRDQSWRLAVLSSPSPTSEDKWLEATSLWSPAACDACTRSPVPSLMPF